MTCVFCDIAEGTASATVHHQDARCLVIDTINPVAPGHMVVLPRTHYENILDIDSDTLAYISRVVQQVSVQLVAKEAVDGVNVLHAAGSSAQQSVFHFHWHVVPRHSDDGLDLWFRNSL